MFAEGENSCGHNPFAAGSFEDDEVGLCVVQDDSCFDMQLDSSPPASPHHPRFSPA